MKLLIGAILNFVVSVSATTASGAPTILNLYYLLMVRKEDVTLVRSLDQRKSIIFFWNTKRVNELCCDDDDVDDDDDGARDHIQIVGKRFCQHHVLVCRVEGTCLGLVNLSHDHRLN
jgi:hypothetical protein